MAIKPVSALLLLLTLVFTASLGSDARALRARYLRSASPATTVTTTQDLSSPCPPSLISLRCAIDQANADVSGDTIAFAIPPSDSNCKRQRIREKNVRVCTIKIDGAGLELEASDTLIDGYTQQGALLNTNPIGSGAGDNAMLTIVLDLRREHAHSGIFVGGSGDTLRGLSVVGARYGLWIAGSQATISGDFIGVKPDGVTVESNLIGVQASKEQGALIGGNTPAAMNLISGNLGSGIVIQKSAQSAVQGNLIGTDASGTQALGNGKDGIMILSSNDNAIGGTDSSFSNVISANASSGISIINSGHTLVQGNFVGIDITGAHALGNGADGSAGITLDTRSRGDGNNVIGGTILGSINVVSGNLADGIDILATQSVLVKGNQVIGNAIGSAPDGKSGIPNAGNGVYVSAANGPSIGGLEQSTGNLIAFNGRAGVLIGNSPQDVGAHASVNRNTIFSNGGLGIDLSPAGVVDCSTSPPGPNDYTPCPVITKATTENASGTACSGCHVEVYIGTNDPSDLGHGEGLELLGTTNATGGGTWSVQFMLGKPRQGDPITATATKQASSGSGAETSEFAANVAAGAFSRRAPRLHHSAL